MKIKIEHSSKKNKPSKNKALKTIYVGTHKKGVLFLWSLLLVSLSFAIYKNFTVINSHTIHETKTIKTEIFDTHSIDNFTQNFIYDYYQWENKKEALAKRKAKINNYLTSQLQALNEDIIRSDIPTSSKVINSQIWQVETTEKGKYSVVYSVTQEVSENKKNQVTTNAFKIVIHQDPNGDLVIVKNPTIWTIPKRSNYQLTEDVDQLDIDSSAKKEILSFLKTFFKLYPTATKDELAYYMKNQSLPVINRNIIFSSLIDPTFSKTKEEYHVALSVKYLDSITKSEYVFQYNLNLQKEENWKIISVSF
ncbi:conjugal transfer protein [Enterococcus casseliflavus]|uniref:conjugal transfer protein n=1 Tax=Enterococcus casseliflavus TaxID=37734 RepID=UPI003D0A3D31